MYLPGHRWRVYIYYNIVYMLDCPVPSDGVFSPHLPTYFPPSLGVEIGGRMRSSGRTVVKLHINYY